MLNDEVPSSPKNKVKHGSSKFKKRNNRLKNIKIENVDKDDSKRGWE